MSESEMYPQCESERINQSLIDETAGEYDNNPIEELSDELTALQLSSQSDEQFLMDEVNKLIIRQNNLIELSNLEPPISHNKDGTKLRCTWYAKSKAGLISQCKRLAVPLLCDYGLQICRNHLGPKQRDCLARLEKIYQPVEQPKVEQPKKNGINGKHENGKHENGVKERPKIKMELPKPVPPDYETVELLPTPPPSPARRAEQQQSLVRKSDQPTDPGCQNVTQEEDIPDNVSQTTSEPELLIDVEQKLHQIIINIYNDPNNLWLHEELPYEEYKDRFVNKSVWLKEIRLRQGRRRVKTIFRAGHYWMCSMVEKMTEGKKFHPKGLGDACLNDPGCQEALDEILEDDQMAEVYSSLNPFEKLLLNTGVVAASIIGMEQALEKKLQSDENTKKGKENNFRKPPYDQ